MPRNRSKSQEGTGMSKYRVVQWATGNVGSRALRRAIEHPQVEVVALCA